MTTTALFLFVGLLSFGLNVGAQTPIVRGGNSDRDGSSRETDREMAEQQRNLTASLLQRITEGGSSTSIGPSPFASLFGGSSSSSALGTGKFSGSCGSVRVDCGTHRISIIPQNISPKDSLIDCGRMGLTKNGVGRVGGLHSGSVVKDGVEIDMPGMGQQGGGKVFHTCFWRQNPFPTGQNNSAGCVHTSPFVLQVLKSCRSAPMEIVNAEGGGPNPNTGGQFFQQSSGDSSGISR